MGYEVLVLGSVGRLCARRASPVVSLLLPSPSQSFPLSPE